MALTSNLYPPLLPNVIPGFDRSKAVRIYFAISEYNSKEEDIENVQVLLTEVKTNKSALDSTKFPSGIKLISKYNIFEDQSIENDFKYYILLNPSDIQGGEFAINTYYKLQLRFTSTNAQTINADVIPQAITSWINNNLMYFSEWSKAALIRGINAPTLNMTTFSSSSVTKVTEDGVINYILPSPPMQLAGTLTFSGSEQDYLKQYNIKIYVSHMIDEDALVLDSGAQYPTTKNKIFYHVPYTFEHLNYYYYVYVTYTTRTLYQATERYTIKISENGTADQRMITIARVVDTQNGPNDATSLQNQSLYGYIHINLAMKVQPEVSITDFPDYGTIVLRRSSSKDNFNTWEDLYTLHYPFKNIYWRDITVENGIFYKYGFYRNNSLTAAHEAKPIITPPQTCIFNDSFLIGGNSVFKLAFNPSLSNFKYNTSESQQVTLGSKYPFIKRNAKNYYRTFSISGLVSSLSNEYWWQDAQVNGGSLKKNYYWQHNDPGTRGAGAPHYIQFTSKEDIYDSSAKIRNDYVKQSSVLAEWKKRYNLNNITNPTMFDLYKQLQNRENYSDYLNPLYERMFRQKFYEFLYDGNVKLFKSPTEGNILIRLTDITFEPVNELGRILYLFSATATEIDEPTFKNYLKYGVVVDKFIDLVSYGVMYSWSPLTQIARMTTGAVQPEVTPTTQQTNNGVDLILEERYVKGGKVYGSS